ncbi:hypothetical protein RS030_243606 [Cryptosporidium xiaoi]|uniref:NTF2 domain-containing protein n=1 Tax=Cryptosporidium xiaoi TaxID=659607 RepID=A0AAV9XZQ3_9CRYT
MNKLDLSLIRKKLLSLKNESCKSKYIVGKKINRSELLEYLKCYVGEIEDNFDAYNYKRNKLSIVLVSEFLLIGERILSNSELKIKKKENQRKVTSELNNEIRELLVITSNYVIEVSKNDYLRGLVSIEFPNILVYLLNFASSGLIETNIRCKLLEASISLLKHKESSKISESKKFRICLYKEGEYILKRLWKSMCDEIVYDICELNTDNLNNITLREKKETKNSSYSCDDTHLFISLILDIYCNILHYNRFLTDKSLLNNCIRVLTENVKILVELVFSSSSNICFKSSIILRSLLLDTENCKYVKISDYLKESGYILLLLAVMLREITKEDIDIIVNNWVLLAQIISILSQNDDDIFDLLKKLFPKKFMRIFNDKWFINKKVDKNIILPWFPKNCDWYNINTNILLDDVNVKTIEYNNEMTIGTLNLNDIIYYGKKMLNDIIDIIDINMNYFQDIVIKYKNIINKNSLNDINCSDKEYIIRRYPDYTWYIFWELCKNNYEDQLDLIWNNKIKKELISALLIKFDRIRSYNEKTKTLKWNINFYHPDTSMLTKELLISDSCYLRLLIPTLVKINEKFGLFNLLSEIRFGSNLSLIQRMRQFGHMSCFIYHINKIKVDKNDNNNNKYIENTDKNNNINKLINTIKNKLNFLYNEGNSIRINFNVNNNKEIINDKLSEDNYMVNNDYNDWEIIEHYYDLSLLIDKNNINVRDKYLDDKLMNVLINSEIPYIECIENCEKIRSIFSSLFQKIISENTFLIKSYMLYCYVYYLLVFNEYILEQQLIDHIQYLLLILTSINEDDTKYRYHVTYIIHIILTLYEEVRKEFINIGGLNIISEVILDYQKNWSISKQINIYLQDDIIDDIVNDIKQENIMDDNNINWDKYINIFSGKEKKITNYKLMLSDNIYNEINNNIYYNNVTYNQEYNDHYLNNYCYLVENYNKENGEIYILEKPELNEMINNGIIYNGVLKIVRDKSEKGNMKIKTHIQLMNIWLLLINENELNITLKDYLRLYDENSIILSEIPSGVTTNSCVTPKNKMSSYFDLISMDIKKKEANEPEIENKLSTFMCHTSKNNIQNIENIIKIMNDNDRINYNELLIWLITLNNCLILSKLWVSKVIDSDELISYLIRIILINNKLLSVGDSDNNYHIFWVCKILRKILIYEKSIILKYIDNNIVEVLLFTLLRYNRNQTTENNNILDSIIILLKDIVIIMNEVITSDDLIQELINNNNNNQNHNNHKVINNKRKCNKNCNIINGCVYGDIMCLIFNIMKKVKLDNNMEINDIRMINIVGYGVYCLSKYFPLSLIELLINRNNISLFKDKLFCENNTSIKIKWDKISRIRTLIYVSNKLLNNGLNTDINEENEKSRYNECCNNNRIENCIEIMDQYCHKNSDLNIFGYNIIKMLNKIVDFNNELIKNELSLSNNDNIYNNWLLKSRENKEIFMELIEMDNNNITLLYKYYLKNDTSVLNNSTKKYQSIWNILNYYLFLYFIYYIIKKKDNNKNIEEKYIIKNILNIVKLQFNLIIIGVSYVKDDNMLFIKDNKDIKLNIDKIFDQFIDKYYQYNTNNHNSNKLIYIHDSINKIIYNNNLMNGNNDITNVFIYNLKILNAISEINGFDNKISGYNTIDKDYYCYESNILINLLNEIKVGNNSNNKLLNSSLLLYLLFNDNGENEIINLLLYSLFLKIKENSNIKIEYKDENKKLILALVEYIINDEFKNMNSITLILILNIIKINILNKNNKMDILKKGIIPKLINELNIRESNNIDDIIIEILIILLNSKDNDNNIIINILNSILTPSLCEILKNENSSNNNNNYNHKINKFKKILNSNIITSKIIWTNNMYIKLKEWCKEEINLINNNKNNNKFDWFEKVCIIDYKERYYKIVNNEINTDYNNKYYYDYKKEEYVYGINILYYALEEKLLKNDMEILDKYEIDENSDNISKIMDYLCDKMKFYKKEKKTYNIYIYCIYKLIIKYGINICFLNNLSLKRNIKILVEYIYTLQVDKKDIIINILLNNNNKNSELLEYDIIDDNNNIYHYILTILGITENKNYKIYNHMILVESKIILMSIIEYIKEKYLFSNINNNENQDKIIDLLLKLINKLITFNDIINNSNDKLYLDKIRYEYSRIKFVISIFKLLFWYDHNLSDNENSIIKEILILSIKLMKEEILYDLDNNKNSKIKEITEIIIYPLCDDYYKKIKNILNIEDNTILNKSLNFTNILINSKRPVEFLEWFTSENNDKFIINWNKKTRNILYINIKNIYIKLQNIIDNNKSDNLFINKIKNICKIEYYKNILNYNKSDDYNDIYQLNINSNNDNNEISCYIIFLLAIKEIDNLMISLNTLNDNNKHISIIINVMIIKYKLILKLINILNINKVLINISNKTINNNITINNIEYINNSNKDNILLLIQDEIENISNIHPNIRNKNQFKLNIKKSINENNYVIVDDINKLYMTILIKNILKLILLINEKKIELSNKIINVINKIIINIMLTKFFNDNCNNNSLYVVLEQVMNDIILLNNNNNNNKNTKSNEINNEINRVKEIFDLLEGKLSFSISDNSIISILILYINYIKSINNKGSDHSIKNKIMELILNFNEDIENNNNNNNVDIKLDIDIEINDNSIVEDPIYKALAIWE